MKKRSIPLVAITMAMVFSFLSSAIADDYESRLSAAKRYAEITPASSMIDDILKKMALKMPVDERAEYISAVKSFIDIKKMEKLIIDTMVKHFTTEELNALADFYGSPVGKSIMGKFGSYMADIQMPLINELSIAVNEYIKNQKN